MEPTANAPRNTDLRAPQNGSRPVAVPPPEGQPRQGSSGQHHVAFNNDLYSYTASTDQPAPSGKDALAERFCWDGNGTAYQVQPLPVRTVATQAPEEQEANPASDEAIVIGTYSAEPAFPPPGKPVMPWALLGVVLLAATALVLWEPWRADNNGPAPIASQPDTSQPPVTAPASTPPHTTHSLTGEDATTSAQDAPADVDSPHTVHPAGLPEEAPLVLPFPPAPAQTPVAAQPQPEVSNVPQQAQSESPVSAEPAVAQAPAVAAQEHPDAPEPELPAQRVTPPSRPSVTAPGAATRPKAAGTTKVRTKKPSAATAGTLVVAVKPWGEVWVDGSKRGISPPLLKLQLPPGRYRIELRNPGLPSIEQALEISAGQSVTLRHNFQ